MAEFSYSRRTFLQLPTEGSQVETPYIEPETPTAPPAFTLQGGLTPYTGIWGREQAAHLLRRATFGCSQAQIDQLYYLGGAQKAVDYILNVPKTEPAPPVNNYNNEEFTDPDVPLGKTWVNARRNNEGEFFSHHLLAQLVDGADDYFPSQYPGKTHPFLAQSFCHPYRHFL